MPEPGEIVDVAVVGAGLHGLLAALRVRRERPDARLVVVDAAPRPGGSVCTQRTNGFVCELGAFGFAAAELEPFAALLATPPAPIASSAHARTGHLFDGAGLVPIAVDPVPWSFRSGNEELVQACRRELGDRLWLGREVVAVAAAVPFRLTLGGEIPATVTAGELVVAVPDHAAGRLLAPFDPALGAVAGRVRRVPAAMVFLGGNAHDARGLGGHGYVPAPGVETPVAEILCCSEVFPGRALPGRALLRAELAGAAAAGADDDVAAAALQQLRAWTGAAATFPWHKVHRFERVAPDGAAVECRARLRDVPRRVASLTLA